MWFARELLARWWPVEMAIFKRRMPVSKLILFEGWPHSRGWVRELIKEFYLEEKTCREDEVYKHRYGSLNCLLIVPKSNRMCSYVYRPI